MEKPPQNIFFYAVKTAANDKDFILCADGIKQKIKSRVEANNPDRAFFYRLSLNDGDCLSAKKVGCCCFWLPFGYP